MGFTPLEKTLLTQAVDLSIDTLTSSITSMKKEEDRVSQREIVRHLLNLSAKVSEIEIVESKPK